MNRRRTTPLLVLLLLALIGGVGLAVYGPFGAVRSTGESGNGSGLAQPLGVEASLPAGAGPANVELIIPPVQVARPDQAADTATTVLWPLRVELELVQAAYLPRDPNTPRIGSGASARLSGRAGGPGGGFEKVRVVFEAGPNEGRELQSDETGRFGAVDLSPGLNIVKLYASSGGTARREVRLRQGRETQLNLGFGRLSNVMAMVQDSKGEGIEGAQVNFDGTQQRSGPNGIVQFPSVTAGQVLVEVEAQGYCAHKELVGVTSNLDMGVDTSTGKPTLRFTLQRTGSLEVIVQPDVGTGPVQLIVLPATMGHRPSNASVASNAGYPWHRLNPITTSIGQRTYLDALPVQGVRIYAFRRGARAPVRSVSIQPGKPYQLVIPLEVAPSVSGRVLQDGEPVLGARVRLEAPNRVRAALAYFKESSGFLESAVMPELPAAVQSMTTKADGSFSFTAWAELASTRYLEAVGPDGHTWAGRFVRKGDDDIQLNLVELETANATLALDFPKRFQGLPVEVFLGGQAQDPFVLPSNELLTLKGLREGTWRIKIDWHGDSVYSSEDIELQAGEKVLEVALPEGAIQGQDEAMWTRLGKTFPFRSD